MKIHYLPLLVLSSLAAPAAVLTDVAFSIQENGDLTWFDASNPAVQGSIDLSGLPNGFIANALAFDVVGNRLLFTSGGAFQNQAIYSVDLSSMILEPGAAVAGTATSVGNFSFANPQMLLGGSFYNGSYYVLRNDSDTLIRIDFDGSGQALPQTTIDLPGNRQMNLGDIAFDGDGNLLISGYNGSGTGANDDRFWRYTTADNGQTFTQLGTPVNPTGDRYNGIGYLTDGETLFGYNTQTENYGEIDPVTGDFTLIYSGAPFDSPGDLSSAGPVLVVPEPSSSLLALGGVALSLAIRRRHS